MAAHRSAAPRESNLSVFTVDKEGNDYLRTMMDDFTMKCFADVRLLPQRLPAALRRLTM